MSASWKHKHITAWTCNELQSWIKSLKLGNKNQKIVIQAINEQEICGEDINSIEDKSDIMDSFPGINKMATNKLYASLTQIRSISPKPTPKKVSHNYTCPNKHINSWNCNELQQWIKSINIETKYENKIVESMADQQVCGEDFNSLQSSTEIMDSFAGINKYTSDKIYKELLKIRSGTQSNEMNNNNNDDEEEEERKEDLSGKEAMDLLASLMSLAVVEEAGFVTASHQNRIQVIARLAMIKPSGFTALRDAVIIGIGHMLKVKSLLIALDALKHKFVHIVLTDGHDTASQNSERDLEVFFLKMGVELGDICKTFFIGVGLKDTEKAGLAKLSVLGGDSCELYNCDDVGISDVFKRISVDLGIKEEIFAIQHQGIIIAAKQEQLQVHIKKNKFLVLFTLDVSGSMRYGRWDKVVAAVTAFMASLESHDIIGCIVFNDKPILITDN